mmetsp:Transcript_74055/g.176333  ORF Transcript_74055/g.176333 Transcript_74055/m.176333 type:complete len:279 (-) Transcript_74055:184-1020(-)
MPRTLSTCTKWPFIAAPLLVACKFKSSKATHLVLEFRPGPLNQSRISAARPSSLEPPISRVPILMKGSGNSCNMSATPAVLVETEDSQCVRQVLDNTTSACAARKICARYCPPSFMLLLLAGAKTTPSMSRKTTGLSESRGMASKLGSSARKVPLRVLLLSTGDGDAVGDMEPCEGPRHKLLRDFRKPKPKKGLRFESASASCELLGLPAGLGDRSEARDTGVGCEIIAACCWCCSTWGLPTGSPPACCMWKIGVAAPGAAAALGYPAKGDICGNCGG